MRPFTFCIGDWVLLHIADDAVFDIEWNRQEYKHLSSKYFEVIGKNDRFYVIKVSIMTNDNFEIDKEIITKYNLNPQHIGDFGYLIKHESTGGRRDFKGRQCYICNLHYPYAEINFYTKLICWSCRSDVRNKFKIEEIIQKEETILKALK